MFDTIVVGVDGRPGGRDALALAARLATPDGAEIVAVRAFPFEAHPVPLGGPPNIGAREVEARAALDAELAASAVAVARSHVIAGSPARVLHRVAAGGDADLIVVGSSHRGALGRVLAGDTAAATLHGSPCAVAIAPRGTGEGGTEAPLRTIGVGFDGGVESRRALAYAAALARSTGAVLHVLEVTTLAPALAGSPAFDESWLATYRAQAATDVAAAIAELAGGHITGEAVVGSPVPALIRFSRKVDLLVVGSRARGPLRRVLLGSTAAALTHDASCPLLVLPRGARSPVTPRPRSAAGATS
jgi:nucleotide-binding universal stress UspA family protein